jgi:hypothetical protein
MILNRLAKALREQNWFGVVVEILVVAVGIVLALQVDTWNESRKERNLEQEYLLRLYTDLQGDIDGFKELRRIFVEKFDFIEELKADTASASIHDDPEAWVHRLRYSLYVSLPSVRSATFDELAGSGRLAIIRDLELRSEIADYYAEYALMREILVNPVGNYKLLVYENFPGVLLYSWRTSKSITNVEQVVVGHEKLRAHPGFQAAANAEIGYAGDLVRYCDAFIGQGENMQALITANLRGLEKPQMPSGDRRRTLADP